MDHEKKEVWLKFPAKEKPVELEDKTAIVFS
jgi:hypothetical protein